MITDKQLVAIGIRVAALFLALYGVSNLLRNGVVLFGDPKISAFYAVTLLSFSVAPVVLAIILWRFPLTITRKILPATQAGNPVSQLPIEALQVAVMLVAGTIILAIALPGIAYWIVYLGEVYASGKGMLTLRLYEVWPPVIETLFEVLFGFWLVLGPRAIISIFRKIRYAGAKK